MPEACAANRVLIRREEPPASAGTNGAVGAARGDKRASNIGAEDKIIEHGPSFDVQRRSVALMGCSRARARPRETVERDVGWTTVPAVAVQSSISCRIPVSQTARQQDADSPKNSSRISVLSSQATLNSSSRAALIWETV